MKNIRTYIAVLAVAIFGAFALAPVATVSAIDPLESACQAGGSEAICGDRDANNVDSLVKTIVNGLLFIIGLASVIMIIIGGFMFTFSAGDAGRVTKAKNTILYSVIGLAVAFFAYAIVNYVIKLV